MEFLGTLFGFLIAFVIFGLMFATAVYGFLKSEKAVNRSPSASRTDDMYSDATAKPHL